MARGPLMPMPTTVPTDLEDMVAMPATATARGPLMPMLTTAMLDMVVMAVTAVDSTAMARGPLMLTTAVDTAMVDTAMAAMADTATASKSKTIKVCNTILIPNLSSKNIIHNSAARKNDGCVSFNKQQMKSLGTFTLPSR